MKRIPKPRLKGKRAILVVNSASPYPYNLLPSQSRGTIRALKTVLKSGGIRIEKILNVADAYNFDKKKEKPFQRARNIARSL